MQLTEKMMRAILGQLAQLNTLAATQSAGDAENIQFEDIRIMDGEGEAAGRIFFFEPTAQYLWDSEEAE